MYNKYAYMYHMCDDARLGLLRGEELVPAEPDYGHGLILEDEESHYLVLCSKRSTRRPSNPVRS